MMEVISIPYACMNTYRNYLADKFPTSLNSMYFLCKQNYIAQEQPRARCDNIKNHTRNGCKKIANPKSDYVTHEVSVKK